MEIRLVGEGKVRYSRAPVSAEIVEIRRAGRKDPIVLSHCVHEPWRRMRSIPRVVGQIIQASRTEPSNFLQRHLFDGGDSGGQHPSRPFPPADADHLFAELTQADGAMSAHPPVDCANEPTTYK